MPSTTTAVFFIVLQLTQTICCYAENRYGQGSNLWDAFKEGVCKGSELVKHGIKIVGYMVDTLGSMCAYLRSSCVCEQAGIDNSKGGTSISEILGWISFGVKTAAMAVTAKIVAFLVLPFVGFGAGGVAAGSLAAWIQSVWFGGAVGGITGWIFAGLQSIGASGLGTAGMAVITFFSGIIVNLYQCIC